MKKILLVLSTLFCILQSCSKADLLQKDTDSNGDCLVSINPIGEISTSDSPLTKGLLNKCYLLQVYQNDTVYAAGLHSGSISSVYLHKGLKYKFVISAIYGIDIPISTNNIQKLSSYSIKYIRTYPGNGAIDQYDYFNSNLNWKTEEEVGLFNNGATNTPNPIIGKTYYSFRPYTLEKETGYSKPYAHFKKLYFPLLNKAVVEAEQNPINLLDWFYAEAEITPSGEYQTLDVNFKRVGYKLKYELSGVTDGEVTVTIKTQSGKILIQNTTNTETYSGDAIFVPFYDIASVYQNPNSYFENLVVSVSWLRGIGVTQDLGSTIIPVKRNNLNRVRISLGNSDAGAAMNLSTEAETMGTESTDITVE